MASPSFTHVYAALIAVVNTKMPEIGTHSTDVLSPTELRTVSKCVVLILCYCPEQVSC